MQYLFGRIHTGKIFETENSEMYVSVKKELPDIYPCAENVRSLIKREWDSELTDEEMLYLMLHINRLYMKNQ